MLHALILAATTLLTGKHAMQCHLIPTLASTHLHSLANASLESVPDQHSFRHAIWVAVSQFLLIYIHLYAPLLSLAFLIETISSRIPPP